MIKHEIIPLPQKVLKSPLRLWCFINFHIFKVHIKSIVGFFLNGIIIAAILAAVITGRELFVNILTCLIGFTIAALLTISLEEFCHAAACVARGKASTINNLIVGYYEKNRRNVAFMFAAVDYYGKFNLIDKFYISAGGPVTTAYTVIASALFSIILEINANISAILFINVLIPFIGLIPSSFILQSDGFSMMESARKLKMPLRYFIYYAASSVRYPLKYCFYFNKDFDDGFINPSDALEKIDALVKNRELHEAIGTYIKLIGIDPFNALYHNNIAWLYYESGELGKALKYSKKSIKLFPDDEDFRDTMEKIMFSLDKNIKAG